jgi:hypothetical protein
MWDVLGFIFVFYIIVWFLRMRRDDRIRALHTCARIKADSRLFELGGG